VPSPCASGGIGFAGARLAPMGGRRTLRRSATSRTPPPPSWSASARSTARSARRNA